MLRDFVNSFSAIKMRKLFIAFSISMQSVGITADNPQDFSIRGFSDDPEKHIALPYDMVCAASVDELNFLAARIEQLDPAEIGKLNAALQQKNGFENIGQVIDFTYNAVSYTHLSMQRR